MISDPTAHPLWPVQVELEQRMSDQGIARFRRQVLKAYQKGTASETPAVRQIIATTIEPLSKEIAAYIEAASSGRAGRRHTLVRFVRDVPPDELAFLTVKFVLNNFARPQPLVALAVSLGAAVEIEQRLAAFAKTNAKLVQTVMDDLNRRTSHARHRRNVVLHLLRSRGDKWASWSRRDQLLVGSKLIEMMATATPYVEIFRRRIGRRTVYYLHTTPRFRAWLVNIDAQLEVMSPEYLPCVVPPKDWTGLTGGGYHTDAFVYPPSLVKTNSRRHRELLAKADLSEVFRAVNAIQRTGWTIEKRTLAVLKEAVDRSLPLADLPPLEDEPLPTKPVDIDTNEEARTAWKRAARAVYESNHRLRSRRLQTLTILREASEFSRFPAIYFPCQLDFRGRIYTIPQVLTPQGSDLAKGLLVFAEGAPITDGLQAGWLAVHGANCFGHDKVSLEERIDWAYEHRDRIEAVAKDPLGNLWWTEADSPWCFLTWCLEWTDFLREGFGFVSRIPVSMDGTCNGLQHYSAMLRDPVGGAAVNLLPADKPQDIYAEVAKVVMRRLEQHAASGVDDAGEPARYALGWLRFGVDRKITKRPVMVLPYGGTIRSCKDYVEQAVLEKIASGSPSPFPQDELPAACRYLGQLVWGSIGDVVVAARAAMDWLQSVARVVSSTGNPLVWTTPSGFVVHQNYPQSKLVQVETTLHGSIFKPSLHEDIPDSIDKRKQVTGIAPNFVHSLDAAALVATVNLALDNGVPAFAMIHDSFGTLAAHAEMLARCTRHAFVDMYEDHDVLREFRDGVASLLKDKDLAKLPQIPSSGTLDLSRVLESQFFFA